MIISFVQINDYHCFVLKKLKKSLKWEILVYMLSIYSDFSTGMQILIKTECNCIMDRPLSPGKIRLVVQHNQKLQLWERPCFAKVFSQSLENFTTKFYTHLSHPTQFDETCYFSSQTLTLTPLQKGCTEVKDVDWSFSGFFSRLWMVGQVHCKSRFQNPHFPIFSQPCG